MQFNPGKTTKRDFLEIPLFEVLDRPRHENPNPNQERRGFLPWVDPSRQGEHHIQVDQVVGGEMPKHFDEIINRKLTMDVDKHTPVTFEVVEGIDR